MNQAMAATPMVASGKWVELFYPAGHYRLTFLPGSRFEMYTIQSLSNPPMNGTRNTRPLDIAHVGERYVLLTWTVMDNGNTNSEILDFEKWFVHANLTLPSGKRMWVTGRIENDDKPAGMSRTPPPQASTDQPGPLAAGGSHRFDFGAIAFSAAFAPANRMTTAPLGATEAALASRHEVNAIMVRPDLAFLGWTAESGMTVSLLADFGQKRAWGVFTIQGTPPDDPTHRRFLLGTIA